MAAFYFCQTFSPLCFGSSPKMYCLFLRYHHIFFSPSLMRQKCMSFIKTIRNVLIKLSFSFCLYIYRISKLTRRVSVGSLNFHSQHFQSNFGRFIESLIYWKDGNVKSLCNGIKSKICFCSEKSRDFPHTKLCWWKKSI